MSNTFADKHSSSPRVFFVLGAPGSGKGTICQLLSKSLDFHHLSVGDFLRTKQNDETHPSQRLIREYLSRQELIPGDILVKLIEEEIRVKCSISLRDILLDGFPRSMEQLQEWARTQAAPASIIHLNCSKEVCQDRYLTRRYANRPDDNEDVFLKRYQEFETNNSDIMINLESLYHKPFIKIDAMQDIESTFSQFREYFRAEKVVHSTP